ncbi:uncharacterized protein RAG0_12554 [Rhynchosporium agropyri]|uniref:ATP-dependent DNA helicase n=1 Tax=Rhynchosporium agropyri TaxID=914238 RepID=A0A1E1L8V3_9HELO|nr:uncharacterized protein RAG0_12554 [Rhynchosporium agropyri]
MTANPKWLEVTDRLRRGQGAMDRPDVVARVFRMKIEELLRELKGGIFGEYAAFVYTIEYQKRGLPHLHLLPFLKPAAEYVLPQRVDEIVSAEIPDDATDPTGQLQEIVLTHMLHGSCGTDYLNNPCMTKKHPSSPLACSKRFPKAFQAETRVNEDGYPEYRRRDDGRTFTVTKHGRSVVIDNRWVVPHNLYLLNKYRCHINVEVCGSVQAVKYIHKYVYEGADRTTLGVKNLNAEVERYVQARYVSPPEAIWRLFEFRTHQEFPPVTHLPVHFKGEQPVYFSDDMTSAELAARKEASCSLLLGYFKYNTENPDGPQWLYSEFPARFVWSSGPKTWTIQKRGIAIGRMYHCTPISGARFYLRLLLTVVRGAKSFEELYIYEGIIYESYLLACVARGLADNDQEWYQCFDEALLFTTVRGLRTLFLTGLRQKEITEPQAICDRYKTHFCDDLALKLEGKTGFPLVLLEPGCDYGLWVLSDGLGDYQQPLKDFGLRSSTWDWAGKHAEWSATAQMEDLRTKAAQQIDQLNIDQQAAFTAITDAVRTDPATAHFYFQGKDGTGKTFLYQTLTYHYRADGKTVLCVASTGIAALLLPNGRTSHSQFKIPINLNEWTVSSISKQSQLAGMLRTVDLIIWDEVPMQHKYCFEVVHRLLVDLRGTSTHILFGGVPVIMGGDFAQILPVVPHGSRADIRVREGGHGPDFVNWVGSIPYDEAIRFSVTIPPYIHQPGGVAGLIDHVYPPELMVRAPRDPTVFNGRCLLSTLNTTVTELNRIIITRLPGVVRTYLSIDKHVAEEDISVDDIEQFPVEMLNNIDIPALPPAVLHLKVGTPIMLLRNLNQPAGLCNGSRMAVTSLWKHCIEARLIGGDFNGELRVLPRIKLTSSDDNLGITLERKQFPVRLSFAMTINKSQGQSFHTVGLDLRLPVFTHGQLYVGISRTSSVAGLSILLPVENQGRTPNVVYPEVLQDIT